MEVCGPFQQQEELQLTLPLQACYAVATGDLEDAPAPDSLHKFDVVEKDGAVYVRGKESDIKAGRRKPTAQRAASEPERIVIVGG